MRGIPRLSRRSGSPRGLLFPYNFIIVQYLWKGKAYLTSALKKNNTRLRACCGSKLVAIGRTIFKADRSAPTRSATAPVLDQLPVQAEFGVKQPHAGRCNKCYIRIRLNIIVRFLLIIAVRREVFGVEIPYCNLPLGYTNFVFEKQLQELVSVYQCNWCSTGEYGSLFAA